MSSMSSNGSSWEVPRRRSPARKKEKKSSLVVVKEGWYFWVGNTAGHSSSDGHQGNKAPLLPRFALWCRVIWNEGR